MKQGKAISLKNRKQFRNSSHSASNSPFVLNRLTIVCTYSQSDLPIFPLQFNNTATTFSRRRIRYSRITKMDDNGGAKLNGIRQIVRLKEIIQKWQHVTLGAKENDYEADYNNKSPVNGGINPAISMRLKGYAVYSDSDVEDGCQSPDLPNDVPKGYLAVYVGPELRRFIIPTTYLSDPLFKVLLQKVEEEFGFDHSGGLTIPCEIETFKYLLNCMEHHQKDHLDDNHAII